MAFAHGCNCQLVPIIRYSLANRRHEGSVLFLFDLRLSLVDSMQFDLIEPRISRYGRVMSVSLGCEIEVRVARHDYMHSVMQCCDGGFIGRIHGRLRRDKGPRAKARVCGSRLNSDKKCEQRESKNWAS